MRERRRVLLIEDDPEDRDLVAAMRFLDRAQGRRNAPRPPQG